jgi:2-C-methyl-D-erythritol 4-phosphate cytidylyltransferase
MISSSTPAPLVPHWVVVPAAGSGERLGSATPKQYLDLCGRSMLEWAVRPFLERPGLCGIVVALAAGDEAFARTTLPRQALVWTCPGGTCRAQSVRHALASLAGRAEPDDWVLVHDAARPCLERADVDLLLDRLAAHPVGGLLATPLTDTLKQADGACDCAQTVARARLWRALTPQMFRFGLLDRALADAQEAMGITDEASAIERLGLKPRLIAGRSDNIKVTGPDDLALARAILAAREARP